MFSDAWHVIAYGKDFAEGFIEVHHIVPLSAGEQVVDPAKDLIPVCANCHRMLHHKKASAITIDQ
jgi:putative restriction endonuclease